MNNVNSKQSLSKALSTEEGDSRKSYTPYINYTKLEFKVDAYDSFSYLFWVPFCLVPCCVVFYFTYFYN